MVAWNVAIESSKGQQDRIRGWVYCTRQNIVDEGTGKAPVHLTSRNQALTDKEAGRCSTSARRAGGLDGQLAALNVRVGRDVCPSSSWRVGDEDGEAGSGSGRDAGYERRVTAESVTKLCEQGQLTQAVTALEVLGYSGCRVSKALVYAVLKECVVKKDLALGRRVHALAVKKGYESDTFLCNHILRMYASHGRLQEAMDVFRMGAEPDAFMWSSVISAHVRLGEDEQAIQLYHEMRGSGVKADGHVFVVALQACARGKDLESGQQVHADVLASGLEPDVFVCSGLVDMYAKCGSLEDAQRVFDGLGQKNVVTWNAMIAGYSQQGMGEEALGLYRAMLEDGMAAPDSVTFVCLLQACASAGTSGLEKGRQLHRQITRRGLQGDVFVANSLVNMYAKCGSLEDAQGVFDGLEQKNVVTWSAMIAGYSQQGMGHYALGLYRAMQEEGVVAPNAVTFVCLLQACASVTALHLGRELHIQIRKQGLQNDVLVAGSLINMYGKCGSMLEAQQVFEVLPERDIVVWSALIAGYTRQGDSKMVFDLLLKMGEDGIQPNGVVFLSVLTVCSHTGLVDKGQEYFEAMSRLHGITPTADHYTCMVDLLGRSGQLDEALALIRRMSGGPNASVLHTLMSACRKWNNVDVGRHAFDEAVKLDERDAAAYLLMSSIYTGALMWKQAQEMHAMRKRIKARKQPGQSWWTDMDGLVHSFLVGNKKLASENDEDGVSAGQAVAVTRALSCLLFPHTFDIKARRSWICPWPRKCIPHHDIYQLEAKGKGFTT